MNKKLQSLLEIAIVIGALVGTPTFAIAAFALIDASVPIERVAAASADDFGGSVIRAVDVKF
jgi:hypothetical protein